MEADHTLQTPPPENSPTTDVIMTEPKVEAAPPPIRVKLEPMGIDDMQNLMSTQTSESKENVLDDKEQFDISHLETVKRPSFDHPEQEVRVAQLEAAVKIGCSFLNGMCQLMDRYKGVPECEEFQEQFRATIGKAAMPRVLAGVLGNTGSGKSSLLNALLDEENIVPTNCMRACTAAVVEVAYNTSNKEAYRAEIEFISVADWEAEFQILVDDIKNRPEEEDLNSKSTSDTKVSYEKLAAVYPGQDILKLIEMTPGQLSDVRDLSILGTTTVIKEEKARHFSRSIKSYIDSSNKGSDDEGAYWPLIKAVKLFTKSPLLEHGLVLVDLPGLGDQNAARRRVTEEYVQNLHQMWIVADIVRAVDNQVARDLLGDSFRRQLLMDGRYHDNFITFVMSKTDIINNNEAIHSLGLKEKVLANELKKIQQLERDIQKCNKDIKRAQHALNDIKRALKPINKGIKELKNANSQRDETASNHVAESSSSSKKRKRDAPDEAGREESPEAAPEESEARKAELDEKRAVLLAQKKVQTKNEAAHKEKLNKLLHERKNMMLKIRSVCIQKRNEFAQEQLRADFQSGYTELAEEFIDQGGSTEVIKPKGTSRNNLNVFCVSTKGYQGIRGQLKREKPVEGFNDEYETQIPALQDFAVKSTLPERQQIAETMLENLELLAIDLTRWAKKSSKEFELNEFQRARLDKESKKFMAAVREMSKMALNDAAEVFKTCKRVRLEPLLSDPSSLATQTKIDKIFNHALTLSATGATNKAIARREGVFKNKKGEHNWNELFAQVIVKPVAPKWNWYANKDLKGIHDKFAEKIIAGLRELSRGLTELFTRVCGNNFKPLQGLITQIELLEKQVERGIDDSIKTAQKMAMKATREVSSVIKKHMKPYYQLAASEKGKGMGQRIRDDLADHLNKKGQKMYKVCCTMLLRNLEDIASISNGRMAQVAEEAFTKLDKDLDMIIKDVVFEGSGVKCSELRMELQTKTMDQLRLLNHRWQSPDLKTVTAELRKKAPSKIRSKLFVNSDDETDEDDESSEDGGVGGFEDGHDQNDEDGEDDGEDEGDDGSESEEE